ncbi:MAG: 4-amino-4-deoxy-L-arabinose-phosphoundecaprenol flippase subunit ArnE [Chroococcopsis gigantea SAG 12.99]|jgi:transporter family protein|nr:4-amino-4-deoxy-L-arabinose-phosphoundecaprenol flippase subunit ArnE [Chroococcopsis gigantea SAG 12.99]
MFKVNAPSATYPPRPRLISVKIFVLLSALVTTQVLGDIWLSRGMKAFGVADPLSFTGLYTLIAYLLGNPWIWLGVATLIISLFLYFISVSRLDLSYVLPIHASNYVFNALFAWVILGEKVSAIRWASAFIITLGVLLVGISENPDSFDKLINTEPKRKFLRFKRWLDKVFLFATPIGVSAVKTWVAVLIIVLADAGGDLFNAVGTRQVGAVKLSSLPDVVKYIGKILTNTFILRGILCQTVAFISFVSVLSWADISLVRPCTALTYIFTLIGAKYILGEEVKRGRLIGIIIVGCGVALIALD